MMAHEAFRGPIVTHAQPTPNRTGLPGGSLGSQLRLPSETVAAAASKMKGRVSKWLQGRIEGHHAEKLLSGGYFACTTGETTTEAVSQYLENQGEHHGYMSRLCPPVFVQHCPLQPADEQRLNAKHPSPHCGFMSCYPHGAGRASLTSRPPEPQRNVGSGLKQHGRSRLRKFRLFPTMFTWHCESIRVYLRPLQSSL